MYCTLEEIKTELDVTDEKYDSMFMSMMEQAQGFIDDYCDRQFDTTAEARYFDGVGGTLFIDDLVSVTTLKLDEDSDGTYESTMATTDYVFYPLNGTPKTYVKISSDSDYGGFAAGIKKGVEITATWGYASTIPHPIRRAAIIQVCRWFKRSKGAYEDMVGLPEMGTFVVYKGLDPDVALLLDKYRKRNIG